MGEVQVRDVVPEDGDWLRRTLDEEMAGTVHVRRGEAVDMLAHPALVAELDGHPAGVLVYLLHTETCELALLLSLQEGRGVAQALVAALRARADGRRCISVTTTNDNLRALGFYQRQGFRLRELRVGAVDETRRTLKPEIPLESDGIPLRDELELELPLVTG